MTSKYDTYTSPLAKRNASTDMLRLWSARHKFNTWRRIWLAVAEAQHELGLPVTKEQVKELRAVVTLANPDGSVGITDDEIHLAEKYERELRRDVMAHVHALGDSCYQTRSRSLESWHHDPRCHQITVEKRAVQAVCTSTHKR